MIKDKKIIPTKDEIELIKKRRKEEEDYQKMMRESPKVYANEDDKKIKIRI